MEYTPDTWVMLKITTQTYTVYKILAGWTGGFTSGDSWKLNSGCIKVEKTGDTLVFTGASGSTYCVYPNAYRLSLTTSAILRTFQESVQNTGIEIEMLPENTDWLTLDYSNIKELGELL